MHRVCHRCHADLAGNPAGPGSASDDDRALFCPRCGAPQILLPLYLRAEAESAGPAHTTGTIPPPRPQLVEWAAVLACAAPVALVTAAFAIAGIFSQGAFFAATLCLLSSASIVLGLYRARRPLARIDGRVGVRAGALTGLLIVAFAWAALSATGVVERFRLHGMAEYDQYLAKQTLASQEMTGEMLGSQVDDALHKEQIARMATPEFRAAGQLIGIFVQAGLVLLLTTGLGGLAGVIQQRRRPIPRD